ncbi:cation:proton antiporter [Thalassolituus sp. LLYu03]|uniref:cation:proton antiporter domain-containing protein n=1 Tax=Thalassolituus sp. LLYu03 TaxID=3421656 RepID=UPI003D29B451
MLESPLALLLAAAVFIYGLLSRKTEQAAFTAPMLFTTLGIVVGPAGLNWLTLEISGDGLRLLAELSLALILFTDASQIERSHLLKFEILPIRLLAVGLPLTMALGALLAHSLFAGGWLLATLLAIILAPTDAALAQAVFNKKDIAERLRHSITVESGLNDGIALPVLLFVLALLAGSHQGDSGNIDHLHWLVFISGQFLIGSVWGLLTGRAGGWLSETAARQQWMTPLYQRLSAPALALIAYSGAESLHGNGFIAAFLAGLFLQSHHTRVIERLKEFGEAEGQLLSLLIFFFFGLIFVPDALTSISLNALLYALLSLTLIRIIPVLIALTGSGLPLKARLFLAWFGPRGIASILYLLLVMDQLGFTQPQFHELFTTAVLTVLISVYLHGLSSRFFHRL